MIQTAAFLAPCLRVVGLPQVGCATQHCESKRFATSKCTVLLMIRRYFWKSMRTRERLHQIVWCYVISIWVLLTCFKWRHMLFIATSWWHTLSSSLYPKAQEAVEEVRLRGCFAWSRRDLQEVAAGARRDWTRGVTFVGWFEIARWRRAKVSCLEPLGSTWLGSLIKLLGKTGETLCKIWTFKNV